MKELTYDEKLELYLKNSYNLKPPPVSTMFWETHDWIRYIDQHGEWYVTDSTENN